MLSYSELSRTAKHIDKKAARLALCSIPGSMLSSEFEGNSRLSVHFSSEALMGVIDSVNLTCSLAGFNSTL